MWNRVFLAAVLAPLLGCAASAATDQAQGQALTPCQELVQLYCGDTEPVSASAVCRGTPSCEAARLTAQHEANNCQDRLQAANGWVPCVQAGFHPSDFGDAGENPNLLQNCTDLVNKVCGLADDDGGVRCGDAGSCVAALEVQGTMNNATCVDALGDDTSFPRCALR